EVRAVGAEQRALVFCEALDRILHGRRIVAAPPVARSDVRRTVAVARAGRSPSRKAVVSRARATLWPELAHLPRAVGDKPPERARICRKPLGYRRFSCQTRPTSCDLSQTACQTGRAVLGVHRPRERALSRHIGRGSVR